MSKVELTFVLFQFFRCVDLVAELSQNPKAQKEVISLIPLVTQAAHFKHYTQHLHLLETVCTQVTNFTVTMLHYCALKLEVYSTREQLYDLTWKLLVFWKTDCWGEMVAPGSSTV